MSIKRIVLDTNGLISSLSRRGNYYSVWKSFQEGKYILCLSNDIIEEYTEVIGRLMSPQIADHVIALLLKSKNVDLIYPTFRLGLIHTDPDDNKFVDCAFAANATYIVSDDSHFDILKGIKFPEIMVLTLREFLEELKQL